MITKNIFSFEPIFQYRIWGGTRLKTVLKKNYDESNIGESWEISTIPGNESQIKSPFEDCKNLQDLLEKYTEQILGKKNYEKYGTQFPLLIKFIDADEPLSVQVHPADEYASKHHNSFGKTEMWYVMEAEEGAEIISGFKNELDAESYRKSVTENTVEELLQHYPVKKGDVIFLPAGRIHAIGAGILLAEIQQSSDVTYRIFDYNRVDTDGKKRELHNERAPEVIDFKDTSSPIIPYNDEQGANLLVECPYFRTVLLNIEDNCEADYTKLDSFVILMCVAGSAEIVSEGESMQINLGETLLIPAAFSTKLNIVSENCKLLEIIC